MSRIAATFARCEAEQRAAFIPFIMAGDPNLADCARLLDALPASGADIIELGMPFSDPMADGQVIQDAGLRALAAGTTVQSVLTLAREFRAKHTATPLVLMGYLNPLYVYGYEKFARDAQAAGVDGIIIVDLPPEEAAEFEPLLSKHGIALVRLIAPTSVPDRLDLLVDGASGYLYYIAITGITGASHTTPHERIREHLVEIRNATDLPICVGFGVKTPDDVRAIAANADGVVVGSAIVKSIHENNADAKKLATFVRALADGCAS